MKRNKSREVIGRKSRSGNLRTRCTRGHPRGMHIGMEAQNQDGTERRGASSLLTCLSFNPKSSTSSNIVNLGTLPPSVLSSLPKSLGSYAILLPPSIAVPAWPCPSPLRSLEEPGDGRPGDEVDGSRNEEWVEGDGESETEVACTRRRDRPPAELIALRA
jgi:hypothetical protein